MKAAVLLEPAIFQPLLVLKCEQVEKPTMSENERRRRTVMIKIDGIERALRFITNLKRIGNGGLPIRFRRCFPGSPIRRCNYWWKRSRRSRVDWFENEFLGYFLPFGLMDGKDILSSCPPANHQTPIGFWLLSFLSDSELEMRHSFASPWVSWVPSSGMRII